VTLSSVIPPGSRIRNVNGKLAGGHGDLLFCVRAEAFAEHPGDIAWAGLGWCLDETGGGLFVEHHGGSERSVVEQIELSLADMNANRGGRYGPVQIALASAHSTGFPVCAVVVAAYRVSSWHEPANEPIPEPVMAAEPAHHHRPTSNGNVPHATHAHSLNGSYVGDPAAPQAVESPPAVPGAMPGAEAVPSAHDSSTVADVTDLPDVRVTLEKEVDYVTAKRYYQLYVDTFGEMETAAVARQLLHEAEFLEEMLDPRVDKYVAWDREGRAIGMSTLTANLETVPWISPGYFAHHYPDHFARGAILYLGFTLVHPSHRGSDVFPAMMAYMMDQVNPEEIILAWDMCTANDERGFGDNAGRVLRSLAHVNIEAIDCQTYYAARLKAPRQTTEIS
jgi:pyruvoyl-dependent arginine decarboxylase (PvlArgDC)